MAQAIKNVKAGQKFLVIDTSGVGFEKGCIVESLDNLKNLKEEDWICNMKWIHGFETIYKQAIFGQKVKHLKRFKGKIK